ncbi:MAG TPA: cytochrome c oxidase assembly protein [Acidimicrobiales bacterium]|nr:cytochrome c oxidase assembly protein [Acidimicrobiales bacterium]
MTFREVDAKRSGWARPLRSVSLLVGIVLWLLFLLPPFFSWARRYEFVQALQYCMFAFWVPTLITVDAPWARLGLTSGEAYGITPSGDRVTPLHLKWLDRIQLARSRVSGHRRVVVTGFVFVLLEVFWRVAVMVDQSVLHPWLFVVESLSLVIAGVSFMTNLIESPPLHPATTRPHRLAASAVAMWAVWIVAYLDGMSSNSWYHVFVHVAGRGLSQSADQQFSAAAMWIVSASVFIPIVFWNLGHWLKTEEDPSDELYEMVREERNRGFFGTTD